MSERLEYPINPNDSERKEAMTPNEIRLTSGDTVVVVSPDKGAFVSEFSIGGENILYEDTENYKDPNKMKLKGGIPVLFPYAGPRAGGIQHGGAREVSVWTWEDTTDESVTFSLDSQNIKDIKLPSMSKEESVGIFEGKDANGEPIVAALEKLYGDGYRFHLELKIIVNEGSLRYEFKIKNTGDKKVPFAPGLHPYFKADHTRRGEITTNLEDFNLLEIKKKTQKAERPVDGPVSFTLPDGLHVDIDSSPEFKKIVGWALTDESDYICVEPFVADPETPETDEINLKPLETKELFVEFKVAR